MRKVALKKKRERTEKTFYKSLYSKYFHGVANDFEKMITYVYLDLL